MAPKAKTGRIKKSTAPKKTVAKKVKKVTAQQKARQSITFRKTITTTVTVATKRSSSVS